MRRSSFADQLRALLNSDRSVDHLPVYARKASLLQHLEILEAERTDRLLISHLKQLYPGVKRIDQERSKTQLITHVRQLPARHAFVLKDFAFVALRKTVALGFAIALLVPAFFGPFLFHAHQILPTVQAAYLECTGNVLLNSQPCVDGGTSPVHSGDSIATEAGSNATIFFNDFSLARLNGASEAIISNPDQQKIQLLKGGVWLHSKGDIGKESIKISTSAIKAQVPQGSAGIVVSGTTTQLFTTNSALEVQIDSDTGTTKLVTLPPEKKLTIRKSKSSANVKETSLDKSQQSWVRENTVKDNEHLVKVKQKTIEDTIATEGPLPGSVRNFVSKATQSARTAMTWDGKQKFQQNLTELDLLFSETLSLLNKGDKTIADTNFEAYRSKFVSLATDTSASIDIVNKTQEKQLLLQILQKHAQKITPFAKDDLQYALKNELQKLAVSITPQSLEAGNSDKIIADISLNRLLEIHTALLDGNNDLAKSMLNEAHDVMLRSPSALSDSTYDLALLDAISEKSPELSSLALNIKQKMIGQLRSVKPQHQANEISGTTIVGTVYKDTPDDGTPEENQKLMKVVGQAIKEG